MLILDRAPLFITKPLMVLVLVGPEKAPALVMVPVPVVLMLLAVLMLPKPVAMEPLTRAPTVVKEEVMTLEASVVPEMSAAALTVILALGKVMVLLERVGSVMAKMV